MRGATGGRASARPAAGAGTRAVGFRTREVPGDTEGVLQRLLDEPSPESAEEPKFEALVDRSDDARAPTYRRVRAKLRMSSISRSGCSMAAKWPPRGISVHCVTL